MIQVFEAAIEHKQVVSHYILCLSEQIYELIRPWLRTECGEFMVTEYLFEWEVRPRSDIPANMIIVHGETFNGLQSSRDQCGHGYTDGKSFGDNKGDCPHCNEGEHRVEILLPE
jgi:hypothetical protein